MKTIFRILSTIFFITLVISTNIPVVYACSCVPQRPAILSYFHYDVIFSGRVIVILGPESIGNIISTASPTKVSFEVYKSYKGVKEKNITVNTAFSGVSCGYEFRMGEEYLVYGTKDNIGNIHVNNCGRTNLLSYAQKDVFIFSTLFFLGPLSPLFLLIAILFIGYWIFIRFRKKPVV